MTTTNITSTTSTATRTPQAPPPDTAADAMASLLTGDGHARRIARLIRRKSFCTLATVSPAGRPHSAGVVYVWADGALWAHTMSTSRKGRNIAANEHVGVTIPFRRLPAGPPYTIHFQATATLVEMTDPTARRLIDDGTLKLISGHGALDELDGAFIRITPVGNIHSYGPGARAIDIIRDPLHSGAGITTAEAIGEVER
jgi:Pyridoxamine 5'-phosphate oxidase